MPRVTKQSPGGRNGPAPKPGGVLGRVKPSAASGEGLSMLLYGEAGTGKTTFWATFPRPLLAVICEGVLKNDDLSSLSQETLEGVYDVVVQESAELEELGRGLAVENPYATVVVNHCTGLQDLCLAETLKKQMEDVPAHKHFGIATDVQWGYVTGRFKDAVRPILNLGCNRVFVAHEKLDKPGRDDKEKESELLRTWVRYNLIPNAGAWLAGGVNHVCQMTREPRLRTVETTVKGVTSRRVVREPGVDFCLRTQEHDFYASKIRKPKEVVLPEFLRDPSYEKFLAALRGEGVE